MPIPLPPDPQPTPEEINQDFNAMGDSVAVIDNKIANGPRPRQTQAQANAEVERNSAHLTLMLSKPYIQDDGRPLTTYEAAIIDGNNYIAEHPTGVLFTGRGGGGGAEDLNVSYYTEFTSVEITEAETELYVPGTETVIPYGSGGEGQFDSQGDCFAPGDYLIQIRVAATASVIAEFEVPLAPEGVNVSF